jgi:hypothetical protein
VCVSVSLSLSVSFSVSLSVSLSVYFSVYFSVSFSLSFSFSLSISLSFLLFLSILIHLCVLSKVSLSPFLCLSALSLFQLTLPSLSLPLSLWHTHSLSLTLTPLFTLSPFLLWESMSPRRDRIGPRQNMNHTQAIQWRWVRSFSHFDFPRFVVISDQ